MNIDLSRILEAPAKRNRWKRRRKTGRKANLFSFLPSLFADKGRCATQTNQTATASDGTKYAVYSDGSLRKMGVLANRRLVR